MTPRLQFAQVRPAAVLGRFRTKLKRPQCLVGRLQARPVSRRLEHGFLGELHSLWFELQKADGNTSVEKALGEFSIREIGNQERVVESNRVDSVRKNGEDLHSADFFHTLTAG